MQPTVFLMFSAEFEILTHIQPPKERLEVFHTAINNSEKGGYG